MKHLVLFMSFAILLGLGLSSSIYWVKLGDQGYNYTAIVDKKDISNDSAKVRAKRYDVRTYSIEKNYREEKKAVFNRQRATFPLWKDVGIDTTHYPIITKE